VWGQRNTQRGRGTTVTGGEARHSFFATKNQPWFVYGDEKKGTFLKITHQLVPPAQKERGRRSTTTTGEEEDPAVPFWKKKKKARILFFWGKTSTKVGQAGEMGLKKGGRGIKEEGANPNYGETAPSCEKEGYLSIPLYR